MYIIFSEILAWSLIFLSLIGFKIGCIATDVVTVNNNNNNCVDINDLQRTPSSISIQLVNDLDITGKQLLRNGVFISSIN